MQTSKLITTIGFCLAFNFSTVTADCDAYTVVISSCVKGFTLLNWEAKNDATHTSCRVDKFKDSCLSLSSLKKCLGEPGRSRACTEKVTSQFKAEGFMCTLKQIEDAVVTCGASFTTLSLFGFISAVSWTTFLST